MTLEEFAELLRESVDAFEKYYRVEAENNPEFWPQDMEAGDWFDQFMLWEEEQA